jgi:desulfoferrodoxin (superoxide reductase-like protein)
MLEMLEKFENKLRPHKIMVHSICNIHGILTNGYGI